MLPHAVTLFQQQQIIGGKMGRSQGGDIDRAHGTGTGTGKRMQP